MTRRSKREIARSVGDLEGGDADPDLTNLWRRSASGENVLDDPEVVKGLDELGWPDPWKDVADDRTGADR